MSHRIITTPEMQIINPTVRGNQERILTSRRVDIHFEPSVRGDDAIHMLVVQILDVVTGRVVETELLQRD